MVFEDLNEWDGPGNAFVVSNESISMWRKALEGISVEKAAGICSGGEVSFFALLPSVTKKLELIDHAYHALYYAIGKYHTIGKLGASEALKALASRYREGLQPLFDEANAKFPTSKHRVGRKARGVESLELTGLFGSLTQEDLEAFINNREKISFLHGDLNDLVDRGPYDLVYLSNAPDYSGRNGKNFQIEKMVKPGGYVLHTCQNAYDEHLFKGFEVVFRERMNLPWNQVYELSWTYTVAKTPA